MILQQYYTQKKATLEKLLITDNDLVNRVQLYSDYIFTHEGEVPGDKPVIMFQYEKIDWNTSSEKEYKADVNFCVYIARQHKADGNYEDIFQIAAEIDKAVLLYPTKHEVFNNPSLITNAAFKEEECQVTNEEAYWNKNDFFIWKICYKTTLIEKENKKKYTLITNTTPVDKLGDEGYSSNLIDYAVPLDEAFDGTPIPDPKESIVDRKVTETVEIKYQADPENLKTDPDITLTFNDEYPDS